MKITTSSLPFKGKTIGNALLSLNLLMAVVADPYCSLLGGASSLTPPTENPSMDPGPVLNMNITL
jgi:hypothetical protein